MEINQEKNKNYYDKIIKNIRYKNNSNLILIDSDYNDNLQYSDEIMIKIRCINCDYEFNKKLGNLLRRELSCIKCFRNNKSVDQRLSDEEVNKRLSKYNLKLVGDFINMHKKIELICPFNHIFERSLNHIIRGQANCPECQNGSTYFTENICRKLMEYLFEKKFEKVRNLKWLMNNDGYYLELDGYNAELNLAYEYNGIQHYKYLKYWHKTMESFDKIKQHDILKKELCIKNNIKLIVIPYTIQSNDIFHYIKNECNKNNIIYNDKSNINIADLMIHNVYINDKNKIIDIKLNTTTWKRISNYIGSREHLTLECIKCKNIYQITYDNIMRGFLNDNCNICFKNDCDQKIKYHCEKYGYYFEEWENNRLKYTCKDCHYKRNTCTSGFNNTIKRITPCHKCKKNTIKSDQHLVDNDNSE